MWSSTTIRWICGSLYSLATTFAVGECICLMIVGADKLHHCNSGMVIVELGSSTGRATNQLAKWFPEAQVLAIESEPELVDYARKQQTSLANLTFVQGSVFDENLLVHLKRNLNLQSNFADLVLSTHVLHLDDPQIELAFANIAALLKPSKQQCFKFNVAYKLFFKINNSCPTS